MSSLFPPLFTGAIIQTSHVFLRARPSYAIR